MGGDVERGSRVGERFARRPLRDLGQREGARGRGGGLMGRLKTGLGAGRHPAVVSFVLFR